MLELELASRDRASVRREVVDCWLAEVPGGPESRHQYRYNVEALQDGSRIYLLRPAGLNKGMDFKVYCEEYIRYRKGTDRPPSHRVVSADLAKLAEAMRSPQLRTVRRALLSVWNCDPPSEVIASMADPASLELERVLKLVRWLFIEQDIAYWTFSGRWMLRHHLESVVGAFED